MTSIDPISNPGEFKEIPGFGGYWVGSDRSVWGFVCPQKSSSKRWLQLKSWPDKRGVVNVKLKKPNGNHAFRYVERLYKAAFDDPFDINVNYKAIECLRGYRFGDDGSAWSSLSGVWRKLKPHKEPRTEHLLVTLITESGKIPHRVGRLILTAFVGPCPPGMECCHHPDNDPRNNRLNNIRWGTRKDNVHDRELHGNFPRGEFQPAAKMDDNAIREIRSLYNRGSHTQKSIAELYEIDQSEISRIISRERWSHVE